MLKSDCNNSPIEENGAIVRLSTVSCDGIIAMNIFENIKLQIKHMMVKVVVDGNVWETDMPCSAGTRNECTLGSKVRVDLTRPLVEIAHALS